MEGLPGVQALSHNLEKRLAVSPARTASGLGVPPAGSSEHGFQGRVINGT